MTGLGAAPTASGPALDTFHDVAHQWPDAVGTPPDLTRAGIAATREAAAGLLLAVDDLASRGSGCAMKDVSPQSVGTHRFCAVGALPSPEAGNGSMSVRGVAAWR
jgi:hypothetical protein